MFSPFNYPAPVAADHLEENGYPALAEFFREPAAPVSPAIQETIDKAGKHKKVSNFADKAYTPDTHALTHPYFSFAALDTGDYKPTEDTYDKDNYLVPGKPARTRLPITIGKKGEGYVRGYADRELHQRILHELTGRTDLAREIPEIPDDHFHPTVGLGGGLKSRFTSGEHTYETRFDKAGMGDHHIFSFEHLTAKPDQDEYGITGTGNAKHTLTQVAARFIHGLRILKPTKVTFSAEEPSRVKLYNRLITEIPKYTDYEGTGEGGRYTVRPKKLELQKGWDGGDDEISGPEGWIDADGNYHENQPGPYGVRHNDTLTRLGYKNVGEGIRAGLMHLASPDGSQLLGHRSDRQYTPKQLGTLKKLAAKHSLEPAITTTSNGTVTTRSLKLSKATPPHGWIDKEGKFYNNADNPKGIASHYEALKHHGFLGEQDTMDIDDAYEKAHAQGLMHVSSIMGDLHGHHPKLDYTLPMLSKLKQLGKEHGLSSVSVTTKTNGKPGTRQLKLSRHPLAKYPMIYADHLDETGYPALAEFYREHAKKAVSTKFWNLHTKGGYRSLKLLAPLKITHPDFSGAFEGSTGIVLGHRAKGYHTGTIADMPEGLTDRIREELTRKLTLAAEKAPAGGMVSNNQFYEGGKFLPRALKSIREVRNRKLAGKIKPMSPE